MNSPAENRHRIATRADAPQGSYKHGGHAGDEAWSRMLLSYDDMHFAEVYGTVNIKADNSGWLNASPDNKRLPHRRNF